MAYYIGIDLGATNVRAAVGDDTATIIGSAQAATQIFPSVISGFIFAMLLSLNEFIITFMVSGPDTFTMPLLIFDRLRRHLTPEMNAIGAMLLLSGLLVAIFAARFDPRLD